MTAPKLTDAQLAVLRELAKPGAVATLARPETRLDYWWLSTNYQTCTRQINVLISAEYATEESGVINQRKKLYARISDAGRAYLIAIDKEPK